VYGQGVTSDAGFTFTFEEWNLYDDSEAWCEATTGTLEERLHKLADPERRRALKEQRPQVATAPIESVTILGPRSPETEPYREMTVAQAGELMGRDPVDAMLDIAVADGLETLFFAAPPQGDSELLREIVQDPYALFGVSDGGAHTKFLTAGRYPTETLAQHVRDKEWLSYENAHWRLSALPAALAGFKDRGVIAEGSPADIVVYDPERLAATPVEVVHDLPGGEWRRVQRAVGYRHVLVNGVETITDDQPTDTHPGVLLRHGSA
jgi:N-acyl-D-aspartate/D-glutamate deacylase